MSKADIAYEAWTQLYQDTIYPWIVDSMKNTYYEPNVQNISDIVKSNVDILENYFEEVITPLGIVK